MSVENEPGIRILLSMRALIVNDKMETLLIRRSDINKSNVGLWEITGGKVNANETLEESLRREVEEKIGIKMEVISNGMSYVSSRVIPDGEHQGKTQIVITKMFHFLDTPSVKLSKEHDDFVWVSKEEALSMNLKDSTREALIAFDFM